MNLWPVFRLASIVLSLTRLNSFAQEIYFTRIPPPDNEPLFQITALTQDPQGFIWIATQHGLFKYGGHQYLSYYNDPSNPNSLADNWVESVFADKDGIIWIGTNERGLDRLDPESGNFTHYRHQKNDPTSLANDRVNSIIMDRAGTLWIGTRGGLDNFKGTKGQFVHHTYRANDPTSISNNYVSVVYEDKAGTIWAGCGSVWEGATDDGGLNRLDKKTGRFTRFLHNEKDPASLTDNRVRAIFEDSRGLFWIGTAGDGLHIMDRATGTFKRCLYEPAHPNKLSRPAIRRMLPFDDHITRIIEDIKGRIWIISFQNGVNVYNPNTRDASHYGAGKNGLATDALWTAYRTRDGVLWMATYGTGGQTGMLYKVNPYRSTFSRRRALDSAKNLWIGRGIIFQGFGQHKQAFLTDTTTIQGRTRIWHIEKDISTGKLWLSTYRGLIRFDPVTRVFTAYRHQPKNKNSPISDSIYTSYQDKAGRLWLGSSGSGLDMMNTQTGNVTHFQRKPLDKTSISDNHVQAITADGHGNIWVSTLHGLNRLDERKKTFRRYLPSSHISFVEEDDRGNIWAATYDGLYKFDRDNDHFSMLSAGPAMAESRALRTLKERKKNPWIGTVNMMNNTGAYFGVKPTHDSPRSALYITGFSLGNRRVTPGHSKVLPEPLLVTQTISLSYAENTFSFGFEDIDYVDEPEENHLYYKLENYDGRWRSADETNEAYYFNVQPGNYVFKVKLVNDSGLESEKVITVIISPPWYGTWWAKAIGVLVAAGIVIRVFRGRVKKIHHDAFVQNQLKELEMKALRAQMNPHFIYNALNSIQALVANDKKTEGIRYIGSFSRLLRGVLDNSEKNIISLDKELETVDLYIHLESLRLDMRLGYEKIIAEDIVAEFEKIPPLILQPFVENALWHGLGRKEGEKTIKITISITNDWLNCEIADNGIGRQKAEELKNNSVAIRQSKGIDITRRRLIDFNDDDSVPPIEFFDLTDDTHKPSGTRVVLHIKRNKQ
jgi:ligand-binding sensor domain-containing protein